MLYLFEVYALVIGAFILALGGSLVLYAFMIGGLFVARLFRRGAVNRNQFHRSRFVSVRPDAPRPVSPRRMHWLHLPRYFFRLP